MSNKQTSIFLFLLLWLRWISTSSKSIGPSQRVHLLSSLQMERVSSKDSSFEFAHPKVMQIITRSHSLHQDPPLVLLDTMHDNIFFWAKDMSSEVLSPHRVSSNLVTPPTISCCKVFHPLFSYGSTISNPPRASIPTLCLTPSFARIGRNQSCQH